MSRWLNSVASALDKLDGGIADVVEGVDRIAIDTTRIDNEDSEDKEGDKFKPEQQSDSPSTNTLNYISSTTDDSNTTKVTPNYTQSNHTHNDTNNATNYQSKTDKIQQQNTLNDTQDQNQEQHQEQHQDLTTNTKDLPNIVIM